MCFLENAYRIFAFETLERIFKHLIALISAENYNFEAISNLSVNKLTLACLVTSFAVVQQLLLNISK